MIVETECRSFQGCPPAQESLPITVADYRDLFVLRERVRRKQAPEDRGYAQNTKEIPGDGRGICPHGLATARDRLRPSGVLGQRVKAAAARAEIIDIGLGKRHSPAGLIQLAQLDDSLLIRIRQRPQESRVQHAENRGRSTDAKGKGENCGCGKTGMFGQGTKRVFQIGDHDDWELEGGSAKSSRAKPRDLVELRGASLLVERSSTGSLDFASLRSG